MTGDYNNGYYLTCLIDHYQCKHPDYKPAWEGNTEAVKRLENFMTFLKNNQYKSIELSNRLNWWQVRKLKKGDPLITDEFLKRLSDKPQINDSNYFNELLKLNFKIGYINISSNHFEVTEQGRRFFKVPHIDCILTQIAIDRIEEAQTRDIERLGGCTKYGPVRRTLKEESDELEKLLDSGFRIPPPKED